MVNDKFYLQLAIDEAWKYQGLTYPNPAVGCCIVNKNGAILALNAHKKAGFAHGELEATKEALKKLNPNLKFPKKANLLHEFIINHHNNLLKDSSFYVTLEPCSHQGKTPSCAILLKHLNIKKIIIGSLDKNKIASGGAEILKKSGVKVKRLLEKKCDDLVEPFYMWQNKNFSFFKLAMSINGVIDGGIITSRKSRKLVHSLRDKCDLLTIGGNTVRVDKPTLDSRMVKGKAPDILIYSKSKEFDKNIPLFKIPNRKVFIENNFAKFSDYKFNMIEGGEGMLKATSKNIKWFLLFHSPNFKTGKNIQIDKNLKLLWQGKIGKDTYGWYKK